MKSGICVLSELNKLSRIVRLQLAYSLNPTTAAVVLVGLNILSCSTAYISWFLIETEQFRCYVLSTFDLVL